MAEDWIPSPVPFFLLGVTYYLISPAIVYQLLSSDNELLYVATKYLNATFFDVYYFLDVLAILGSFFVGYAIGKSGTNDRASVLDYGSFQKSYPIYFAIVFGVLIVYFALTAYASGARFLTGYSTFNVQVLGPFSTSAFMTAWFVNYFSRKQIKFLFLVFFAFCSVLLLGWGTRMFFVLGFMALMLGAISKNRRLLTSARLYILIAIFCLLMVVVGIVRQGEGEFSADRLIGVFFAEPLFTSISGSLYLENVGGRPVYGVPRDILASIVHFVPSVVFPEKGVLLSEIAFDENVESPFGAKSLIVNLYSNFGRFYPIFVAAIGFYFGFLYTRSKSSVFYRATYFSALPILLLLFFREGLITVIKVMVFNGLLVPIVVSLILIWFSPRTIADIKSKISRHNVVRRSGSKNHNPPVVRPRRFL